jgi:hypothetical protein
MVMATSKAKTAIWTQPEWASGAAARGEIGSPGEGVAGCASPAGADPEGAGAVALGTVSETAGAPEVMGAEAPVFFAGNALSKARLSLTTLTCGSPSTPRKRPAVFSATRRRSCSSATPWAFATRGIWNRAAAGVMSGSSPLAEVVMRSTGILVDGFCAASCPASYITRSANAFEVGPRFEPLELLAL